MAVVAHNLLRFAARVGYPAVLDAIQNQQPDFFIPAWFEAGFRFTTFPMYTALDDLRTGVLTLPMPRAPTEPFMVMFARTAAGVDRALFWEQGNPSLLDGQPTTFVCEWVETGHCNYGLGPRYTADLRTDSREFTRQSWRILLKPAS